jgi:hypothetical protein
MAKDAIIIINNPAEPLKATNLRLRNACQDAEVTGAHLVVINGRPIVTLTAETERMSDEEIEELRHTANLAPSAEASEEDVADAKAELKDLEEIDFETSVGEPLVVMIRRLLLTPQEAKGEVPAMTAENACAFTEDSLNKLLEKADGTISSLQFVECNTTHEAYVLVSFLRDAEVHAGEPQA